MKMKFKVGDKVKLTSDINKNIYKGKQGTVYKEEEGRYLVRFRSYYGDCSKWINLQDLALREDVATDKRSLTDKIYDELQKHIGKENAISADDLCERFAPWLTTWNEFANYYQNEFEPDRRKLRQVIREIRRNPKYEMVVGSCGKGYYICTKEDIQGAINRLMNTAKNEFKTANIMAKKAGLDGQMMIQFDEWCKDTYHSLMEAEDVELPRKE